MSRFISLIGALLWAALIPLPAWSEVIYYTTQRGDRLEEIAQRHGISLSKLIRDNNIRHPDRLYSGMRLKIELPPGSQVGTESLGVNSPESPSGPEVSSPASARPPSSANTPAVNVPASSPGETPIYKAGETKAPALTQGAKGTTKPPAASRPRPFLIDYDELQKQEREASGGTSVERILASLIVISLLVYGVVWMLKRMHLRKWPGWLPQKATRGSMRLVETLYLFPTRLVALHLVEVAGRLLLLGSTPSNVQLIMEIEDKEAIKAAQEAAEQTFGTALKDMRVGYEAARREEEWRKPAEDVRKDFQTATQELLRTIDALRKREEPQNAPSKPSDHK